MSKDNFDKWVDQWEKAQKDGIFQDTNKPPVTTPQQYPDNFFGEHRPSSKRSLHDVDVEYWKQVYSLSNNQGDSPDVIDHEGLTGEDMGPVNEDAPVKDKELAPTTKFDNKSVSKITDELGGLANPVNASTRGKDKISKVTPDWAGGENLIELHNMKVELHKLEDKLAADPMLAGNKSKKLIDQIKSLHDKIDDLSSSLNPDFRKGYLS